MNSLLKFTETQTGINNINVIKLHLNEAYRLYVLFCKEGGHCHSNEFKAFQELSFNDFLNKLLELKTFEV